MGKGGMERNQDGRDGSSRAPLYQFYVGLKCKTAYTDWRRPIEGTSTLTWDRG